MAFPLFPHFCHLCSITCSDRLLGVDQQVTLGNEMIVSLVDTPTSYSWLFGEPLTGLWWVSSHVPSSFQGKSFSTPDWSSESVVHNSVDHLPLSFLPLQAPADIHGYMGECPEGHFGVTERTCSSLTKSQRGHLDPQLPTPLLGNRVLISPVSSVERPSCQFQNNMRGSIKHPSTLQYTIFIDHFLCNNCIKPFKYFISLSPYGNIMYQILLLFSFKHLNTVKDFCHILLYKIYF